MRIKWPESRAIRTWARKQGWPAPWFIFDEGFIKRMLESDENFELALRESGIEVTIPVTYYTVSEKALKAFDEAYEERSWVWLVEELRDIRRALDADVVVEIDGRTFGSFGRFYEWAHARYYALEDDAGTGWIGSDEPSPDAW